MYKFVGYGIKDNNNNIIKFGKNKSEMILLCKNQQIPLENLIQLFEYSSNIGYSQSHTSQDVYDFT